MEVKNYVLCCLIDIWRCMCRLIHSNIKFSVFFIHLHILPVRMKGKTEEQKKISCKICIYLWGAEFPNNHCTVQTQAQHINVMHDKRNNKFHLPVFLLISRFQYSKVIWWQPSALGKVPSYHLHIYTSTTIIWISHFMWMWDEKKSYPKIQIFQSKPEYRPCLYRIPIKNGDLNVNYFEGESLF